MQKLSIQNEVPPGGFSYFQSETRTNIVAPDYDNLFVLVAKHRKANNIPIGPLWQAEVEDQLCQKLPAGLCKEEHPANNRRNVLARIGWDDVLAGTKTISSWAVSGFKHVDQALADARANICSRCYYNIPVHGMCASCQHLANLAAQFTGGRRTMAEPHLKACAVCKCSLRVKIWVPIDTIRVGTPLSQLDKFPDFCWIPTELKQEAAP